MINAKITPLWLIVHRKVRFLFLYLLLSKQPLETKGLIYALYFFMEKLEIIKRKIITFEELLPLRNIWRFQDKKVVFTNGCFDLLHLGHIDYLAKAADMGHKLVVGLNSDRSTAALKGPNRPLTNETSRSHLLAALFFVDAVIIFDEETPFKLIEAVKPDVLVKGADYTLDQIVGADVVIANGGEVKTVNYLTGYSTTAIETKIREQGK